MFVRKFEADTLEEALKNIKHELGPDAIVLKTVTNKGIKGAFKKKRIEITAAVTEHNLKSKMKVDSVLADKKDDFYQDRPSVLSKSIKQYVDNSAKTQDRVSDGNSFGYGQLGLNRTVQVVRAEEKRDGIKKSLDDFLLSKSQTEVEYKQEPIQKVSSAPSREKSEVNYKVDNGDRYLDEITSQKEKIDALELKLYELGKRFEKIEKDEPQGIYQLRTSFRSLDISERYIQRIIKKATFELSEQDLMDGEVVFEYALREMISDIKVEMPLFSAIDSDNESVVTVLLSENASGQTSMAIKLAVLKANSVIIKMKDPGEEKVNFAEKIFGLDIKRVNNISEIVSEIRKAKENKKSIFVDYKNKGHDKDEVRSFIDGIKRAFSKVEILVSLSAIHSEMYNRKVLTMYGEIADGLVLSHMDLCLNLGAIFNVLEGNQKLPVKFFGTGKTVPEDLESATAERILAGIFRL